VNKRAWILLALLTLLATPTSSANSLSFTGNLATPQSTFVAEFTWTGNSALTIQTWGFGGGTNAAGAAISPGGFDPLVALFSGTGPTASIVMLAGNPVVSADSLIGFAGSCPPGNTALVGGLPTCGDASLSLNLAPGIYTLVLSDANYIPLAVNPGPPGASLLSDGFTDLTGGVFQTCVTDANNNLSCITPDSHFAVDITGNGVKLATPEPGTLALTATGLIALFAAARRRPHQSTVSSRTE
jgi:hypothetical protein